MTEAFAGVEFNGPFPDWWNVVDDFGADPSGLLDSTAAFQQMLNAMCAYGGTVKNGQYLGYTGYVPNGTYKISSMLVMPEKSSGPVSGEGVNLWGQDPEHTVLKWTGGGGAMLWSDGCHSSTIGRLTFDGQDAEVVGIRLERDPDIPVNNSWSRIQDCIFKDLQAGFRQTDDVPGTGTDSEFSILRCRFYRCSSAGVSISAAEAYNIWVRQCYFEECGTGITNGPSGAFSAYDNIFVESATYDIQATGMRLCGVRRNSSYNSERFLYVNCANVIVEGNQISNTAEIDAVTLVNRFKVMILNNRFKSDTEATTGPVINETVNPFAPGNPRPAPFAPLFVLFNQFTVPEPISIVPQTPINNAIEDNLLNPALVVEEREMAPFPPHVLRETFYVDKNAEAPQATIDAAVAYAAANPGSEPIVYLPCYNYSIDGTMLDRTVVFPAGVRMSLQGGGNRAGFTWVSATRATYLDPYVIFRGPSHVTVQNTRIGFSYQEGHKAGLIAVVDNCDQVEGRVFSDNCNGIYRFEGISQLQADLCDYVSTPLNPGNLPFLVDAAREGVGSGRILQEGSAGSDGEEHEPIVQVRNGGRLYVREHWYETTNTDRKWARLDGMGAQDGRLTIETSLVEQHTSSQGWAMKAIEATDWRGNITYINDLIIGTTQLSGNASRLNYLSFGGGSPVAEGSSGPASMYRQDGIPFWIIDFWTMSLTLETMEDNSGWGIFGNRPDNWRNSLWDTLDRAPARHLAPLGAGITDFRLHRVRGDVTFMSERYIPRDREVEVTSFTSAVLPEDVTFSRASGATMYSSKAHLVFGPENLCLYSQDLNNAAWTKSAGGTGSNPVTTPNDAVAPDGSTTATKIEFDCGAGTTSADFSLIISTAIPEFSYSGVRGSTDLWVKGTGGTQILIRDIGGGARNLVTCSGEWMRVSRPGITAYGDAPTVDIGLQQDISGTINSTATVWVWGVQVERYLTNRPYLPTTAAPIFGLRFQHDVPNGELVGALVEPESTNGVAASWYHPLWTTTNASVGTDGTLAPDQTTEAVKVTASAGAGDHFGGSTATGAGTSVDVAHSAFVKQGSTRYVVLYDDSDAVPHAATFDFDSGAWVGTGTNVLMLPPIDVGGGWWRIGWIAEMTNNVGAVQIAPAPTGTGTMADISYNAAGTEDVYATFLQFDSADVGLTTYIKTRDTDLTREVDQLTLLRANGTYDIEVARQDGVATYDNQLIAGGTWIVPTSTSPVISITTRRVSP